MGIDFFVPAPHPGGGGAAASEGSLPAPLPAVPQGDFFDSMSLR